MENINGTYIDLENINFDNFDSDNSEFYENIQEDLHSKAYELANNRGIRISIDNELLYVYYINFNGLNEVIAALFRGCNNEYYSFDIVVNTDYEKMGLATKLIKISIDDYEIYKEHNKNLIMSINCINPAMSNILEKKFGFKETIKYNTRRIMERE